MLQKGPVSLEAIRLLEEVARDEPRNVEARFLLSQTCLGLPPFFGKRSRGIEELRALDELGRQEPTLRIPDVSRQLAELTDAGGKREAAPAAPEAGGDALLRALEAGRLEFDALDRTLLRRPAGDARAPLHRALLRLWLLGQPGIDVARRGTVAGEAAELFREAMRQNPSDTRIHGWLGPLLAITGAAGGLPGMEREGERLMDEGVARNPEQNLFGRLLADTDALGRLAPEARRARVVRMNEDLYRTIELCAGGRMDRARFRLPEAVRVPSHPACRDGARAPHNRSGTLYWAGEHFRRERLDRHAADAFDEALRLDPDRSWPYRGLAEERKAWVEARLAGKTSEPPKSAGPDGCLLCHRK
jgi:hypothetical protein